MGDVLYDFGTIELNEIVPFTFNFEKYSSFRGDTPEVISSIAFVVYLASDTTQTPITGMVFGSSFGNNFAVARIGQAVVPMTAGDYHVRCRVTCSSGSRYEEQGAFVVAETQ